MRPCCLLTRGRAVHTDTGPDGHSGLADTNIHIAAHCHRIGIGRVMPCVAFSPLGIIVGWQLHWPLLGTAM